MINLKACADAIAEGYLQNSKGGTYVEKIPYAQCGRDFLSVHRHVGAGAQPGSGARSRQRPWSGRLTGWRGKRPGPDYLHEVPRAELDYKCGWELAAGVGGSVQHDGLVAQRSEQRHRGLSRPEFSSAAAAAAGRDSRPGDGVLQRMERTDAWLQTSRS